MAENNIIRDFDFFKSFEKPNDYKKLDKNKILNKYVGPTAFSLAFGIVISLGVSMYSKQSEIHTIMRIEDQKIAKNINQFVSHSPTNMFVVKNYNECSKIMHGTAENIENQCKIYVFQRAYNSPNDLQVDITRVATSLAEFKRLSQYSPESAQKINKLFSELGLKFKDE